MIALHSELGNFQFYMAHKQRPPRWDGMEAGMVGAVLELIERETGVVQKAFRAQTLDTIVIDALKRSGFKKEGP